MRFNDKFKSNLIGLVIVSFYFFLSYLGSFYLAHSFLDINKYYEAIIIATAPIISSILFSSIIKPSQIRFYLFWSILPTMIAEKILIPVYEYKSALYSGSMEESFGISTNLDFIIYLIQGKIGSAYYYNGVYLLTTILAIWFSYGMLNKLEDYKNKGSKIILFILINLCILPNLLYFPLFKSLKYLF